MMSPLCLQRHISAVWLPGPVHGEFHLYTDESTTLFMHVDYDNGDNSHTINSTLPILFTTDKTAG